MIIILRGHIRNSFETTDLYNLIKHIKENYDSNLYIYIHTWNIYQSPISWRVMSGNENQVNENIIQNYFKDLTEYIKHIIIDDDTQIKIHGNTKGFVSGTKCPLLGWKRYLYGSYKITQYVYNLYPDSVILNMRFDICSNLFCKMNTDDISKLVTNYNNDNEYVQFMYTNPNIGIDNCYISKSRYMYILLKHIYFNLDIIIEKYTNIIHQEYLFFYENIFLLKTSRYFNYNQIGQNYNQKNGVQKLSYTTNSNRWGNYS